MFARVTHKRIVEKQRNSNFKNDINYVKISRVYKLWKEVSRIKENKQKYCYLKNNEKMHGIMKFVKDTSNLQISSGDLKEAY